MKRLLAPVLICCCLSIQSVEAKEIKSNTIDTEIKKAVEFESLQPETITLATPMEEFAPVTTEVSEDKEVINPQNEPMCPDTSKYKVRTQAAKNGKGHIVYVNNKQAMWFVKSVGGISTQKRAEVVAQKMQKALNEHQDISKVHPVKKGAYTYLVAGQTSLVTVDEVNAKAFGVSVHELSYTWANNTRIACGGTTLKKDYSDVSRGYIGHKSTRYIGQKTVGMASWYGGNFHGRRSSDGSRFNTNEFTAAHPSYPFGTLLKVTNLRNNKSCVVKVTDRGPYAHGRILDLSKQAAQEIGMLKSGVAKVKVEVVGQY